MHLPVRMRRAHPRRRGAVRRRARRIKTRASLETGPYAPSRPQDCTRRRWPYAGCGVGRLRADWGVATVTISRGLAGKASYDALDADDQAVVRAAWAEQLAARLDAADFAERLRARGRPWPEANADGEVVMRDPGPPASGA